MPYRITILDWFYLACLVVAWGSSFVMSKIALREIDPVWIAAGRLLFGAVILAAVATSRKELIAPAQSWPKYIWLGIVGNSFPFLFITWGMHYVASGVAGLLMGTIPLLVIALAHFFLPGERLTFSRVIGFLLGFAGVVVLLEPHKLLAGTAGNNSLIGELAIILGCLAYAVHGITAKRMGFGRPFEQASNVLIAAAAASTLFALVYDPAGIFGKSWQAYLAVAGLGLIPTGIATIVMYQLMERTSPTFVSTSNYLVPIYAVVFGAFTLGETVGLNVAAALALVIAGVFITRFKQQPSQ
jgi:drug/metabolite transporter (DMT)-like permease